MTIRELQEEVVTWADREFPDRGVGETLMKLVLEEIPELAQNPTAFELADVVILVLDICHLMGVDIEMAVQNKMIINRARKWRKDPITGIRHHVK